jgi:hypothetical protein
MTLLQGGRARHHHCRSTESISSSAAAPSPTVRIYEKKSSAHACPTAQRDKPATGIVEAVRREERAVRLAPAIRATLEKHLFADVMR